MMTEIKIKNRFAGRFRVQVKSTEGLITTDTGWFDNLITNQGLDWIGANPPNNNVSSGQPLICTHVGVGTGTTTPAITDTLLTSFLAMYPSSYSSNVESPSSTSYVAGPPAYWSNIFTYNFAIGAVVGNVAELGAGNTASGNTQPQLFSHALILDGSGNPTTISVTSTDALIIQYELRMYLDLTDNTYSMSIAGVTYGGTYRRCNVTSAVKFNTSVSGNQFGIAYLAFTNGVIGPVTGSPSGTIQASETHTWNTYTTGTYSLQGTTSFSLTQGNVPGGVTTIQTNTQHGQYQFAVSPAFPKSSVYTCTITWSVSWARYP